MSAIPFQVPRTKTEYVYLELRRQIVSLEQEPGGRVKLEEIARALSVSVIPVREAVARLAAERFVVIRAHIGPQVAPVDAAAIHDVFAMISGLESAAAPRVVQTMTEEQLKVIRGAHQELARISPEKDLVQWSAANAKFHLSIVAGAGLPLVEDGLRLAFDHWQRIRLHVHAGFGSERREVVDAEHARMIRYLEERDAVALAELALRHNDRAVHAYLNAPPAR